MSETKLFAHVSESQEKENTILLHLPYMVKEMRQTEHFLTFEFTSSSELNSIL